MKRIAKFSELKPYATFKFVSGFDGREFCRSNHGNFYWSVLENSRKLEMGNPGALVYCQSNAVDR